VLVAPLGGLVFGFPVAHFGVVAVVSTSIAMLWNYAYNLGFDRMLVRLGRIGPRSVRLRILHALLFEAGLLCALVPFIAWYLEVSLWRAFMLDVALAGFYAVYAFAFNWAYDLAYPVPLRRTEAAT
jgi:uncharacterized membrane protein